MAFRPDGRVLAVAGDDHTVGLWDLRTRTILITLHGHTDAVTGVAFSRDGWRLASASLDETIKVWDATGDRVTTPLLDRPEWYVQVRCLAFSRDGRWLASATVDRAVRIWDVSTGLVARTLRGHSDTILCIAFSADGRRLATGGEDRRVILWDVDTGRQRRTITDLPEAVWAVAFSPDGQRLACTTWGSDRPGTSSSGMRGPASRSRWWIAPRRGNRCFRGSYSARIADGWRRPASTA